MANSKDLNKQPTKKTTKKITTKKTYPKIQKVELTTLETKKTSKKQEESKSDTNLGLTILGIIILSVVAILIFTLTYAYFTATIKELNPDGNDVQVISADLLVRYQDGESNIELGEKIEPGDILTKEFSIKNEGNDTGMYTIILENIKHNLGHSELEEEQEVLYSDISYKLLKLEKTQDGTETETIIATGSLPFESGKKEDAFIIYTKDEVLVNKTNYYRLELTYINHLTIDQSDSMGEKLELKVNITEYEGEIRTDSTEY